MNIKEKIIEKFMEKQEELINKWKYNEIFFNYYWIINALFLHFYWSFLWFLQLCIIEWHGTGSQWKFNQSNYMIKLHVGKENFVQENENYKTFTINPKNI